MPNLGLIFLTGLLAGGVSCAAVQGALVATMGADRKKVVWFVAAKLVAHIIFGGLLGAVGGVLQLSLAVRAALQIGVAIYVAGVALAMLEVHPVFRYFLWQTPRFLGRWIRNTSKSQEMWAPVLLGAGTIFIPCGVTQGMMALAMASGSMLAGAAILGVFVLGTTPVFLILGLSVTTLMSRFKKLVAYVLLAVAAGTANSGLVMAGSPVTAQKIWEKAECVLSVCPTDGGKLTVADEVTITFLSNRYVTEQKAVKAGTKVKLNLVNQAGYGCIQAFTIPALGVSEIVPPGSSKTVDIIVPDKPGRLDFSCSMGMYSGQLTIVN